MRFLKIGSKSPQKCQTLKTNVFLTIVGNVGIKKWSPFFCFGTRIVIFSHLKIGTFAKSVRLALPAPRTGDSERREDKRNRARNKMDCRES